MKCSTFVVIHCFFFVLQRRSLRSPRKMDRLRRSFRDSFRRRKERVPESSKPHQWQADESAVRSGTCTFAVKYLGCVEVFESRGMQVCEEALKVLRVRNYSFQPSSFVLIVVFFRVQDGGPSARSSTSAGTVCVWWRTIQKA